MGPETCHRGANQSASGGKVKARILITGSVTDAEALMKLVGRQPLFFSPVHFMILVFSIETAVVGYPQFQDKTMCSVELCDAWRILPQIPSQVVWLDFQVFTVFHRINLKICDSHGIYTHYAHYNHCYDHESLQSLQSVQSL